MFQNMITGWLCRLLWIRRSQLITTSVTFWMLWNGKVWEIILFYCAHTHRSILLPQTVSIATYDPSIDDWSPLATLAISGELCAIVFFQSASLAFPSPGVVLVMWLEFSSVRRKPWRVKRNFLYYETFHNVVVLLFTNLDPLPVIARCYVSLPEKSPL